MGRNDPERPHGWAPVIRSMVRLLIVAVLVWLIYLCANWVMAKTDELENAAGLRLGVLGLLLLAYMVLMAMPFVPGVEIGLSLMVLEGGSIAPFVYVATVSGLLLAYFIGLKVEYFRIHRALSDLHLTRACRLIEKVAPLTAPQRLDLMRRHLPGWITPVLVRHRYILLAVLLNLPGNAVIGGGGGLALIAGFSRLYAMKKTALTVVIAVSPVPIMVYFLEFRPFG